MMNSRLQIFLIFLPVLLSCILTTVFDVAYISNKGYMSLGWYICFLSILISFNIANKFMKKEEKEKHIIKSEDKLNIEDLKSCATCIYSIVQTDEDYLCIINDSCETCKNYGEWEYDKLKAAARFNYEKLEE